MIDKSFSHLVSSVIQYRETCKICNFWGLNLSISVPFSPQLTRVEFRKYPRTRIRAIKTRRNKSNNCNAIYRNGEGEGRGRGLWENSFSWNTALRSCYILSSDKFNMSSPIPLENQPLVIRIRERYATCWHASNIRSLVTRPRISSIAYFHYFFLSISFFFFFFF